jgi:hypothetical protein
MYRGGDCDDLSILVCSLLESIGIKTAFITIPGHIYMAFDSGMTKEQAEETLETLNNVIVLDDEVWVPLEITLTNEGFYKAHRTGAREWRVANAQGKAALYKMEDSWKIYQPISAPGAKANINLPESETVHVVFENSIKEWSKGELKSSFATERPVYVERISPVQETLTLMDTSSPYEKDAVLREDPFSDDSLLDILALASDVVALGPIPEIKEEDLEVFEDEEEKKDSDPNPVVPKPKEGEREPNVVASEPTVGVPEPVEGHKVEAAAVEQKVAVEEPATEVAVEVQKSEPQIKEKKSPLVKVFIAIGALFAAAAGLFIFGKKKRVNK